MHAGGGTGKTFVTCKIFEELARCNEICHCTYPTGVGALHLPQFQTFHSVFRTWTPSLSAGTVIDEIFKSLGGNQLKMVVADEVSMLSAQFLVLLDTRLRSMYTSDQTFGGISILLIGDFIQLPVTTGCDLAERQKEWQNGRMAGMATYVLFMVHADTDTDDDTDDDNT